MASWDATSDQGQHCRDHFKKTPGITGLKIFSENQLMRLPHLPKNPAFSRRIHSKMVLSGKVKYYYLWNIAIMTWTINRTNLSRDMTKPTKWLCTQRRLSSAWASDQSLRWRKHGSLATQWAHSEDSDQTGRMLCWFCHVASHFWFRLKQAAFESHIIGFNVVFNKTSYVMRKPVFGGLRPDKTQTGLLSYRD